MVCKIKAAALEGVCSLRNRVSERSTNAIIIIYILLQIIVTFSANHNNSGVAQTQTRAHTAGCKYAHGELANLQLAPRTVVGRPSAVTVGETRQVSVASECGIFVFFSLLAANVN